MTSTIALALIWQQQFEPHDHRLLMVFIGMVAVALVIQAICVIAAVIVLLGAAIKVKSVADEAYGRVLPLLTKTHDLLEDISPKVSSIAANARDISATVREKTDEFGRTASELNETLAGVNLRARGHVQTADRIVSSTLTSTEEIKDMVVHGIKTPVRQMVGLVAGLRAGLESLITRRQPMSAADYTRQDVEVPVVLISEE